MGTTPVREGVACLCGLAGTVLVGLLAGVSPLTAEGKGLGTELLLDASATSTRCGLRPPDYYAFDLVTTKNVPGSALARGTGEVSFAPSPFGIAVSPDGSYHYEVRVSVERLKPARSGVYVAWVADSDLERVGRLGALDPDRGISGRVAWNKFLVIVTLESEDDPDQERWSGPVVMRGMSRSGMMHTMAGHGPFQQENCAAWGFGGG